MNPPAAPPRVLVIAHRGASRHRPQNTMAAFALAVREGCDGIELDLQLSRDGVVVVHHDRTVSKLGGGRRHIVTLSLEEIRALDAGAWFDPRFAGERVPTLRSVLERVPSPTRLLLELKPRGRPGDDLRLVEATVGEIRRAKATARVFLLCFDAAVLELTRQAAPELKRVLNVGRGSVGAALGRGRPRDLAALSFDVRTLTPSTVRAVRRSGIPLFVFTCNREDQVDRALAAGARAIMSDRPQWLAGILHAAGA